MAGLHRFVGRIGKLGNNHESECIVQSYDSVTAEYQVTLLREPEAGTQCVKPSAVTFPTRPDFLDTFPSPSHFVIQDKLDMKNIPSGSIIDFCGCTSDPILDADKLSVMGSYRFVGKRTELVGSGIMRTRLPYCVFIAAPNESDIIEFENILFELDDAHSHNIVCLRGTIVFRDCVIKGAVNGLILGSGSTFVKVTFEKGAICNNCGCGVIVDAEGGLIMIGVKLEGTGVGWYVKNGGRCIVSHSIISNRCFGLVMCGTDSRASISHCTFNEQKYCGVLVYSGSLFMYYSHVSHAAECGIVIWGNAEQTNASLTACRVTSSRCGVRFSGSIIFTCFQIFVSECVIGIYIPASCMGQLQFHDYGFDTVHNTIDFVNFSNALAYVRINDDAPVKDQLQRIQDVNDIVLRLPTERSIELTTTLYTTLSIKAKRYLTRLNFQVKHNYHSDRIKVTCHACEQREPVNAITPMKKCGRCKQVCYCSTGCQEVDWPSHKIVCKMANNWQRELYSMKYFDCQQCHKVTSITDASKGSGEQSVQRPRLCKGCGDVQQCVIT